MVDDPTGWVTTAYAADPSTNWRDAITEAVDTKFAQHEETLTNRLRVELGRE
jgi:hypothetical protein